jgi:nitroreductase
MSEMTLMQALRAQRSARRFAGKPVPSEVLKTVLRAASWAPSAGNRQPWRFLVVTDPDLRRQIGEYYDQGSLIAYGDRRQAGQPAGPTTFTECPAIILVCIDAVSTNPGPGSDFFRGASIYPAMQNMMLAAMEQGLATRPTTIHRHRETEIKALVGIPESVNIAAIVPIGYPGEGEHFGGKKRKPLREFAFENTWGQPL